MQAAGGVHAETTCTAASARALRRQEPGRGLVSAPRSWGIYGQPQALSPGGVLQIAAGELLVTNANALYS